jgi:hypothetical protein
VNFGKVCEGGKCHGTGRDLTWTSPWSYRCSSHYGFIVIIEYAHRWVPLVNESMQCVRFNMSQIRLTIIILHGRLFRKCIFLPKWLTWKTNGTFRKCSSRAFQWMVMSVCFSTVLINFVRKFLCPALGDRSYHQSYPIKIVKEHSKLFKEIEIETRFFILARFIPEFPKSNL